jgi:hypothetical protein
MIRIKIEACDSDELYFFDSETISGAVAACVKQLGFGDSSLNTPSEMAELLSTIAEAIRRYDNGEPPVAHSWDFSSPESAFYVVFFEDAGDDDGTPAKEIASMRSSN